MAGLHAPSGSTSQPSLLCIYGEGLPYPQLCLGQPLHVILSKPGKNVWGWNRSPLHMSQIWTANFVHLLAAPNPPKFAFLLC